MFQELTITRISTGSIFKLVLLGLLFSLVPFCTVMGLFALFGANTISWNGAPIHGVTALIAGPLMGVFISLFLTLGLGALISLGLWVFTRFKPLALSVKSGNEQSGKP